MGGCAGVVQEGHPEGPDRVETIVKALAMHDWPGGTTPGGLSARDLLSAGRNNILASRSLQSAAAEPAALARACAKSDAAPRSPRRRVLRCTPTPPGKQSSASPRPLILAVILCVILAVIIAPAGPGVEGELALAGGRLVLRRGGHRAASDAELAAVHPPSYLQRLRNICAELPVGSWGMWWRHCRADCAGALNGRSGLHARLAEPG
jgi:hypothetical protein